MPDFVHNIALVAANWLLLALALAVVIGPAWLISATVRHHRQRRAFRRAMGAPLTKHVMTDAELDHELRLLLEQEAGQ